MDHQPSRFARLRALFDIVLELPDEQRDQHARSACAGQPELYAELAELLRQERQHTGGLFGGIDDALLQALPEVVRPGSTLGAFKVVSEIGAGGMGRVFRAERHGSDFSQVVAIKLLRQEVARPELLRRFALERQLLAGLEHPGICRLIDGGALADGTPYVVMELVEGVALLEHCDRQRLPLADRLRLFRLVLAAVNHAHRHLVVHRDLKSGNILVDAAGRPKLLDFGIAKLLDQGGTDVDRTATRERYLSFANAAPEQLLGLPVTVACDVYGLGTILYELLCGVPPFHQHQASIAALEQQILKVPPEPLVRALAVAGPEVALRRGLATSLALRRALTGELESIVQKCLRKAPAERYASVEQLDEDLAAFLERRPIRAAPGQRWYRLRKFVARHRLPVALGVLLAVASVAFLVALTARNVAAIAERDRAQHALAILRRAFLAADPARMAGEEVTVRAVLDAALPALEDSFENAPELFATLAGSIAEVRLSLGQSTQAAVLLERAVDAAGRSTLDPGEQYQLLVLLARALNAAGAYPQAELSLQRAARLGLEASPEWQVIQAGVLVNRRNRADGIALLRLAIARMQDRRPDDDWANSARLRLAEALGAGGASDQALAVLEQMLAWQRAVLEPQHPRIALARQQRVIQLRLLGRYDEALAEAAEVLAEMRSTYGADSPMTARAAMVKGNALSVMQRTSEAAEAYREALAIFRQQLGDTHPNTLRTSFNLAGMQASDSTRREETLDLYRTTLAAGERRFGMQSNAVVLFRNGYASALLDAGQAPAALAVLTSPGAVIGSGLEEPSNRSTYFSLLERVYRDSGCAVVAAPAACETARGLLAQVPGSTAPGSRKP